MEQFLTPLYAIFQWQNALFMLIGTVIGVVVAVCPLDAGVLFFSR